MTKIQKTKEQIIEAFEGIKEFEVSYVEECVFSKRFKAKSEEELEDKFNNGELEFDGNDIIKENLIDNSLEIDEVEE